MISADVSQEKRSRSTNSTRVAPAPHHSVAQQSLPLYLATATALNGPDRRRPGHRHIRDFLLSTRRSFFRRFVAKRRVDRRVSAAEQWSTRVCTDRWMDTTLLLRIPRPNQRAMRIPALSVADRAHDFKQVATEESQR